MWNQSLFPCTLMCESEYRFCYSESLGAGYRQLQRAVSALYKSSSHRNRASPLHIGSDTQRSVTCSTTAMDSY